MGETESIFRDRSWLTRNLTTLVASLVLATSLACEVHAAEDDEADISAALLPALDSATELPRLHSLLISHGGELIVEQYFNGRGPDDIANVKSVSKSILSGLVGAAIEQGHLEGVAQPIADFFPDILNEPEHRTKADIRIEDLLTMQSGLETTSNRNYGRWVLSANWVDFALRQPLENTPGTHMQYSTGSTHLLSAILTLATGKSTLDYAREVFGQPLGFHLAAWPTDPQGIHFGGNDMEFTPRQLMRIGQMYMNRGEYNGRQVLPSEWIDASLRDHTVSPRDFGRRTYGYGWWIRDMAGYRTTYAWGYGGQFLILVDELDLVIVATSDSTPGDDRRFQTRALYRLAEYDIIASVARALGLPVRHQEECQPRMLARC